MNRQHGGERYAATEFFDRQKMGILKAFALLWICFAASAWAEAPIDPSSARAMAVPTADGSGKASPSATGTANAFEPEADLAFETGLNYYNGIGVGKDFGEAVKWFRKAAERDYAPAQFFLGLSYYSGHGMPKNDGEAVKWYYKAAEQNYAPAQFGLGVCYEEGQGVPKNNGEAVKWYYKAAEQNLAAAQFGLGLCYQSGRGVPKDEGEAVKWYYKAAERNYAPAQSNLGIAYGLGKGVPKDSVESYKWFLLASANGFQEWEKGIPIIESSMSREEIAEGQKLAREFRPREGWRATPNRSGAANAQTLPMSAGTGFFITEDGYLITNAHVAGSAAQVRLATASGLISAKVVTVDVANDLALLKAEGKFNALPVTPSRVMKLGSTVVSVGFPNIDLQGFAPKFARGEIASLSGPQDDPRFFQISVPLQPGNSGGALVDEHANVIGVVSAKLSAAATLKVTGAFPENVNYAVKSSFLLGFLESTPEVASKLKEPNTSAIPTAEVVEKAKAAAVLVLVALADTARAEELKHPPPPIDLKKQTGHVIQTIAPENPVNSSKVEKSIPYKRTYMRSELDEMQRQHQPADDFISQFGTPDSTETTTAWHYLAKVHMKAERWIYHNLTRDPASQTVDAQTVVVVAEISDGKKFIYSVQYN